MDFSPGLLDLFFCLQFSPPRISFWLVHRRPALNTKKNFFAIMGKNPFNGVLNPYAGVLPTSALKNHQSNTCSKQGPEKAQAHEFEPLIKTNVSN